MQFILIICGFGALLCGVVGIFLPLLPTTPFLLLSAFCFARSSEKFHAWLVNHPHLGRAIRDWQESKSINKKAKISAMVMIILTAMLSIALSVPMQILMVQLIVLTMVSVFILTRPS